MSVVIIGLHVSIRRMSVAWNVIRAERLALVDYLNTLTPAQWATPSLCSGWSVQHVAAHLAWTPTVSPRQAMTELVRCGFRPNKLNADTAERWSRRGPAEILHQLQEKAENNANPIAVPRDATLVDSVVHALDIRRPFGTQREIPEQAFKPAADFCANTRWPASVMVGGSVGKRINGLRLVADGYDWSWGRGPEVRASGETIMLVLTGRRVAPHELAGPGAATLSARM